MAVADDFLCKQAPILFIFGYLSPLCSDRDSWRLAESLRDVRDDAVPDMRCTPHRVHLALRRWNMEGPYAVSVRGSQHRGCYFLLSGVKSVVVLSS